MRPWRVRRVGVPQAIAASFAHSTATSAAAFALTTGAAETRTPQQWARAVFEDAPAAVRWCLVAGWTNVLGLELGPRPSDDHVLGWAITDGDLVAGSTTLLAGSRRVRACTTVAVESSTVTWVTLVHCSNAAARLLWAMVRPLHHVIVRSLLARAARAVPVTAAPGSGA